MVSYTLWIEKLVRSNPIDTKDESTLTFVYFYIKIYSKVGRKANCSKLGNMTNSCNNSLSWRADYFYLWSLIILYKLFSFSKAEDTHWCSDILLKVILNNFFFYEYLVTLIPLLNLFDSAGLFTSFFVKTLSNWLEEFLFFNLNYRFDFYFERLFDVKKANFFINLNFFSSLSSVSSTFSVRLFSYW